MRCLLISFAIVLMLSGCSEYNKLLKSTDINKKYEKAVEYYENEEYYKAMPLVEELLTIYRGTDRAEKLYYMNAYMDYNMGDLYMAAYRFKKFGDIFPTSKYAEECLFMSAYCKYRNSPDFSLDQSNTIAAINEMQLFVNRFPESGRIDSCNKLVDILRFKLERKSYEIAKQYLHMRNYQSASVALKNVLVDYPDTEYREEVMFLILKSDYLLALNSVPSKKEKRITEAIESYVTFVDSFSKSKYLKDAEGYYENVLREKIKLEKNS